MPTLAAAFRIFPPEPAKTAAIPVSTIRFSLQQIVARFPADLQGVIRKQPSDHIWIEIPRAKIEGQLARGAVKLTFAELRAVTPDGFFSTTTAHDQHPVALPLEEVLRQLKPERRAGQKIVDAPAHIAPLFNRAAPETGAPHDTKLPEAWYSSMAKPTPHSEPEKAAHKVEEAAPVFGVPPLPPLSKPPTALVSTPVVPAPEADHIDVPLSLLADALPEPVRRDLGADALVHATFRLPLRMVEPMVGRGKILFEWKHLHSWLQPPMPAALTCEAIVDMPLQVVVPIFLAAKKSSPARKRVEVDMTIPDMFGKSMLTAEPPPAEPVPAPRSSRRTVAPAPSVAPSGSGAMPVPSADSLRPHFLPDEIVSHACEIESIAGAFIATHDGLLVAGQTPGFNERTVSAFAPTLFAQAKAYAQVTGLGKADSVLVMIGERAVQIFRCNKLFFGAVGRTGQPFPTAKLAKIAAQMQFEE